MLRLKYKAVDDDHEPAIVDYDTNDVQSTSLGVAFFDPKTEMQRVVTYDKLISYHTKVIISDAMINRSVNTRKIQRKNQKTMGRATVK